MVGNGTPQLRRIYELLQKHDPYPAEATDAVQEAWMDLAELDSTIAGHVASVLGGERVGAIDIRNCRSALEGNRDWERYWPTRYGILLEACDALEAVVGE